MPIKSKTGREVETRVNTLISSSVAARIQNSAEITKTPFIIIKY
jgi:hypothetical protein